MKYKEVKEWAENKNQELQAGEFHHRDGSIFMIESAVLYNVIDEHNEDENWLVCFSEHHGFFIYHKDDLIKHTKIKQYTGRILYLNK